MNNARKPTGERERERKEITEVGRGSLYSIYLSAYHGIVTAFHGTVMNMSNVILPNYLSYSIQQDIRN